MKRLFKKATPRGDRSEKLQKIASFFLRITLLAAFCLALLSAQWTTAFLSFAAFGITLLPYFIEKETRFSFPIEIILLIDIFIFVTLFLGSIHDFYEMFWWWDLVLHGSFGVIGGLFGFLILYTLHVRKQFQASPFTILLFAFSFAVALGALWEIFEYAMDVFFDTNMQNAEKTGVHDTMKDIIVETIGALIVAFWGYVYITLKKRRKEHHLSFFDRIIKRTTRRNS